MNRNKIALLLGTVCLLLTIGIVVQINTIKGTSSTVSKNIAENSLRDEVLKWKQKYDESSASLEDAEKRLSSIREEATKGDSTAASKEQSIKLNNNLLGLTSVEGKGIELIVEDDPNSISTIDNVADHIVHDADLRSIVNELKNAGAEAISINGQRVVTTTAITCIGNVVKVNDEKISTPFVIRAIGFPESLESALNRKGGYLEYLSDYGIKSSIKKLDKVKISKYNGVITSKYIKIAK